MNPGPLQQLMDETRSLFHRLKYVAEQVHQQGEETAGMRGVLLNLEDGPQTVAQMARSRPVSRQHIQKLVNALIQEGLVHTRPNPEHRRSYLVELTPAGKKVVKRMKQREKEVLKSVRMGIKPEELKTAAEVLGRVRMYFESPEWKEVLNGGRN